MACSFNIEYLLVGGRDRAPPSDARLHVVRLDGRRLGRPQRPRRRRRRPPASSASGWRCSPSRARSGSRPVLTTEHAAARRTLAARAASAAVAASMKGGDADRAADGTVMSYCCDRARSITWGIDGGLPSSRTGSGCNARRRGRALARRRLLQRAARAPATASRGRRRAAAASATRSSATPSAVLEDVIDGYVTIARAPQGLRRRRPRGRRRVGQYEVDAAGDRARARADPRRAAAAGSRRTPRRSPRATARGELDALDLVRRYGVIVDWGSGELLPRRPSSSARCSSAAPSRAGRP